MLCSAEKHLAVALRKESVDRNICVIEKIIAFDPSLSARRAWIEIYIIKITVCRPAAVALRKESVDRNSWRGAFAPRKTRRSPQGERG